jgi:protoporphyrin/coproporphyrin ferrochelatase
MRAHNGQHVAMSLGDYDSVLLLSFGGPEGPEDVVPFLENVTRGRDIPRERLEEVGAHYGLFGGRSPINDQNRALIAALESELSRRDHDVPIWWGNRNWHPLLTDTLREMVSNGIHRSLVLVTSAFSSYSGCRQYYEDIDKARAEYGPDAPELDRVRVLWNHPGFLGATTDRLVTALQDGSLAPVTSSTRVAFSAHSIPSAMASGCDYQLQLEEASRIVMAMSQLANTGIRHDVVYQSRSGPPQVPWLGPDICTYVRDVANDGADHVVVVPIGFVSDHMEVVYDLDTEAAKVARDSEVGFTRVPTVGQHPQFVSALVDLLEERAGLRTDRPVLGSLPACPDVCASGCCPRPTR